MTGNRTPRCFAVVVLALGFVACGETGDAGGDEPEFAARASSAVVATVGDRTIDEATLAWTFEHEFESALDEQPPSVRARFVDSLVGTVAMAEAMEAELRPAERLEIERRVAHFRDAELARRYVARRSTTPPPSPTQARSYYDAHPDEFGAGTVVEYEMIQSRAEVGHADYDALRELAADAASHPDWDVWLADAAPPNGVALVRSRGDTTSPVLDARLRRPIERLAAGAVSDALFVGNRFYLVRAVATRPRPARPFDAVREQAMARAAAAQATLAVSAAKRDAVERVGVVIAGGSGEGVR